MKVDVFTLDGDKKDQIELSQSIFGLKPRADVLQRVVRWQQARLQAGTHRTKTRSEVARTSKKIYRQKGTGGARHGSARSGIFRGGGKAHGPKVRDHNHDLPKSFRKLGLKHALSARFGDKKLVVLDDAVLTEPKTKMLAGRLLKLASRSTLVIGGSELDKNFVLASRNLPLVEVLPVEGINVRSILKRESLIITRDAVTALEARLS